MTDATEVHTKKLSTPGRPHCPLEGQFVGNSVSGGSSQGERLGPYIEFLAGREEKLSLFSKIAYGGLAFWKNNWAGPGGMGAPGNRGDWAASVHDFNYRTNGPIHISMYFNPTISPETARAL